MNKLLVFATAVLAILVGGLWYNGLSSADAPDFEVYPLSDPSKAVSLADFKGKVLLIDFWATWCGPCHEASPVVQELYDRYNSKGLEVLAVSHEDEETLKQFEQGSPHSYPVFVDRDGSMHLSYNAQALPTFVVLDRNGRLRYLSTGLNPDELRTAVEKAIS